jgi:hypothetical protein
VDDHTGELLSFDGNAWTRMAKPLPAKGYYSRGDVLEGMQPIGSANGFWLASAGSAWKWDSASNQWQLIAGNLAQPEDYKRVNEIIGVLPIDKTVLLIIRHEPLPFLVRAGEDFPSDEVVVASNPASWSPTLTYRVPANVASHLAGHSPVASPHAPGGRRPDLVSPQGSS